MFRNDAGRFIDVTAETGVAGSADDWTTSAGFFDYDRDGDLDLFVCNYLRWTREIDKAATKRVPGEGLTYAHPANFDGVQNFLYRNDGGRFTDVAAEAGIHVTDPETGKPVGKALAVTFVDFDQDGWLDIFVANDTVRHFLFRNRGDGTFEEVGESRGFALNAAGLTTSGMGIDAAWIHNDDELAVAMSNFANEMTSLYVLQGKRRSVLHRRNHLRRHRRADTQCAHFWAAVRRLRPGRPRRPGGNERPFGGDDHDRAAEPAVSAAGKTFLERRGRQAAPVCRPAG